MVTQMPDLIMTIDDFRKYRKLSSLTRYKTRAEGKVPAQAVGQDYRLQRKIIDGWFAGRSPHFKKHRESIGKGSSK